MGSETPILWIVVNYLALRVQSSVSRTHRRCRKFIVEEGRSPPDTQPFPSPFVAVWRSVLAQADYVLMSLPYSDYIPWTKSMIVSFAAT